MGIAFLSNLGTIIAWPINRREVVKKECWIFMTFAIEEGGSPVPLGFGTRPSALGMSDPIWGPLIHIFVDEKKN